MDDLRQQQPVKHDIADRGTSLDEDVRSGTEPVRDLTKAFHSVGDRLVALHRRLARLEQTVEETEDEWTTRGWQPPPGSDHGAGGPI